MNFATPPRSGKEALITAAEKQSMLDNLDLEGNAIAPLLCARMNLTCSIRSRGSNQIILVQPGRPIDILRDSTRISHHVHTEEPAKSQHEGDERAMGR